MGPNKARLASLAAAITMLIAACGTGQQDTSDVTAGAVASVSDSAAAPAASAPAVDAPATTTTPATAAPATAAPAEPTADDTAAPAEATAPPAATAAEEPTPQEDAPPVEVDDATAEAAAESNLEAIRGQDATGLSDFQVLDVANGSISTLQDAVTGDRPVLLWFFSPH